MSKGLSRSRIISRGRVSSMCFGSRIALDEYILSSDSLGSNIIQGRFLNSCW